MKKKLLSVVFLLLSLLLNGQIKNRYVVDKNGQGDFRTVQEALDAIRPSDPRGTMTIFIRKGIYHEKVVLPSQTNHVRIVGEDRDSTVITYDDQANINKMGTFRTYTLKLSGNDILLENLTIENASEPLGQAVALHVDGDRAVFRNCRFLGHQDTVYAGRDGSRLYFENCDIEGTTDFIFGPATAWFEDCLIYCKRNSYITASNTPADIPYGFIFNNCRIVLADTVTAVYLGRPWRPYSMTVFLHTEMPKGIRPEGWDNWKDARNEKTVRYAEYKNYGEGSGTVERVKWSRILSDEEAAGISPKHVLGGCDQWNPLLCK